MDAKGRTSRGLINDMSRDSLFENVKINPITGNIAVGNAIRGTSSFHDNDASDFIKMETLGVKPKH